MKLTLQNRSFLAKISLLLLMVLLGYMAQQPNRNSVAISADFNQATSVKNNTISQLIDNNWFTHQTR